MLNEILAYVNIFSKYKKSYNLTMLYLIKYLSQKTIGYILIMICLIGGLTIDIQQKIKERFYFYPIKIAVISSALFEFFYGYSFFSPHILKILNEKTDFITLFYALCCFFFVAEGLTRLGSALKGLLLPILPIYLLDRLIRLIFKYEKF